MVTKRKNSARGSAPRRKNGSRAATGKDAVRLIDDCVRRGNPALRAVANELRKLVRKTVPEAREAVNPWGIPMFELNGALCLLMVGKEHVTFGFPRGASLSDPEGLLEGTGKNMRHVKLREVAQVGDANLRRLIAEAAALNRETPLTASMRVKKKS